MIKKRMTIEAEILRLDFPNKGFAQAFDPDTGERITLRVKGVLPGQRVRCVVTRNGSGRKEARLTEVVQQAPVETQVPCTHFSVCGGCSYQTLDAQAEMALKEDQVKRLLNPVLERLQTGDDPEKAEEAIWDPPLDSPRRFGYRNKMEFTWGDSEKDGPLALGLHRRGSKYDIESVTDCRIVDEDYRKILKTSLQVFSPMHEQGVLSFYHRMTGEGYLRHLLVRKAAYTGEILVDLVTTTQRPAETEAGILDRFKEALLQLSLDGCIVGILHTVNDARADAVRDEGTTVLYGQDHFYEELLGLRFRITPFSFFQTNSYSAEVLYSKVREYVRMALAGNALKTAASARKPVVYDLYSGTGTIAQIVSPVAERVAGIEIVPEAVEAAKKNATENGIENCVFFAGDVLKLVDDPAVTETVGRPDLIILDPPREGIHPKALPKILDFGVSSIIYVSCKPTSLAADLEGFLQNGYRVEKICVCNQFPCSVHVETIVLIERVRNAKDYVQIGIDAEDYYRIKDAK